MRSRRSASGISTCRSNPKKYGARFAARRKANAMFPASFEYHRAGSVKEALSMLQQYGEDGKLLAGGHSLIPMMKLRLAQPAHLVDIGGIKELTSIREEGGKVVIGGLVTHHAVETSQVVRTKLGMLAECASLIGDVQVRNRG